MRIYYWIDHTARYRGNSGVQRVVRSLAHALIGQEPSIEIIFVTWDRQAEAPVRADAKALGILADFGGPVVEPQLNAGQALHRSESDRHAMASSWLLVPEVTHLSASGEDPTQLLIEYAKHYRMRTAFVFYDLIPLRLEGYDDIRAAHEAYVQRLLLADIVLPISAAAGADLRSHWTSELSVRDIEQPLIVPCPIAFELTGLPRVRQVAEPRSGTVRILSVGTIEPRKNQVALLQVFKSLRIRHPQLDLRLTLIGHIHPGVGETVAGLIRGEESIELLGYLSDSEMIRRYAESDFTVFPSVMEGFGLPIAESLWFGRPCLCAEFGSMSEIAAGGGCLVVDTRDREALEAALERLILDQPLRRRLNEEAVTRQLRTWAEYGRDLLAALGDFVPLRRAAFWVDQTVQLPYHSGVQRVVRGLAQALHGIGVELVYVKWDEGAGKPVPIAHEDARHLSLWNGPPEHVSEIHPDELRQGDWFIVAELLVPPSASARRVIEWAHRRQVAVAFIFYDLIPWKLSDLYPEPVRQAFASFWKDMSEADVILPISQAAGEDFRSFLHQQLPKLNNLHRRIAACPLPGALPNVDRETNLPPAAAKIANILCVGTIEPRKNHRRLIEAYRTFRQHHDVAAKLTIVGSMRPYPELVKELRDLSVGDPSIEFIGHVDDDVLGQLYRECRFTVYASFEEGFGLPILESLWRGRPCICHHDGALAEAAQGGGCLQVDMLSASDLADGIALLAQDASLYARLAQEAVMRPIPTWMEYGRRVSYLLDGRNSCRPAFSVRLPALLPPALPVASPPLLSICVTTYNRGAWLKHSLARIMDLTRAYRDVIEVVVCDNASSDETPAVVASMTDAEFIRSYRNPVNVGMLGNLDATAAYATGRFVWVIGDDDLLAEGVIEDVLEAILDHDDIHMVYLNYAYTHFDRPGDLDDIGSLLASAIPIADGGLNRRVDQLREVAGLNENLFTAIYACIFRRDHARRAYGQHMQGPPFSSLETCVPTSVYALQTLIDRPAYWIGRPSVVVNMNVSWRKYVLLWHLERMPDLYDLAEISGVDRQALDGYRANHCNNAAAHARAIYFDAPDEIRLGFSMQRLIERCKHLPAFLQVQVPLLRDVYEEALAAGRLDPGAPDGDTLFGRYGLAGRASV